MTATDRDLRYTALVEQIDHMLDNHLPLASDEGALLVLTTCRFMVRTLRDGQLIDDTEAEALLDRIHTAFRNHNPGILQ